MCNLVRGVVWAILALIVAGAAPARGEAEAGKKPRVVYTYDARGLNRLALGDKSNAREIWDTMHCLAALQGLANRSEPQLYLFYCSEFGVDTDEFWFDWLRNEDGWLGEAEVRPLKGLEEAVQQFRECFKGLVVYDPAVPATANLASTIAGVEGLLPVRWDRRAGSVYERLTGKEGSTPALPVRVWLVNEDGTSKFTGRGRIPDHEEESRGSAKVDAYRWALKRYLLAGKCAPNLAGYYMDSFWLEHPTRAGHTMHTLSNHDYFIARRAFFFDLSCWGDEAPNDDLGQPPGADYRMFMEVLRGLYETSKPAPGQSAPVLMVGGFPPWPYKYTSHASPPNRREGVPTEWEFGRLISQFNGYMEADAAGLGAIANASFYQHYPLERKYAQPNAKPGLEMWKARGQVGADGKVKPALYVGHYVGDYDSPSWLYKAVPAFFRDKERGKVPLGWAFNPNLADRAPQALVYARRHASSNDFFIAGDSGAGYLNPRSLTVRPDSGLPPGLEAWAEHCRRYYERWDLTITGFILDGSGGASTRVEYRAYRRFSPDGAGTHFERGPAVYEGLATCPERDLPDRAEEAAKSIGERARKEAGKGSFLWARSILKSPGWYVKVEELVREEYPEVRVEFVDPYTFFGLVGLVYGEKAGR